MHPIFRTASADDGARAQGEARAQAKAPNDKTQDDKAQDDRARQRAIIEAQLAKKKGGGAAHGPHRDREPKGGGKSRGQFAVPPTRPGQRGRRG